MSDIVAHVHDPRLVHSHHHDRRRLLDELLILDVAAQVEVPVKALFGTRGNLRLSVESHRKRKNGVAGGGRQEVVEEQCHLWGSRGWLEGSECVQ